MRDLFSQIWEDLEKTYNHHSLDEDIDYEGQEPEVLGAEEFCCFHNRAGAGCDILRL